MTKEQVLGMVRHALTFGGGILMALGYVEEQMWAEVSGAVVTLVGAAWSVWDKMNPKPSL